jgi:hypothetical protein
VLATAEKQRVSAEHRSLARRFRDEARAADARMNRALATTTAP